MKKTTLFEVIKKEKEYNLTTYLQPVDILNLSLLSKKYYSQLVPILEINRLDNQQNTKQIKTKAQKTKNNKVKLEVENAVMETQVDIVKMPLHKFAKKQ